jgi:cysteine synthase
MAHRHTGCACDLLSIPSTARLTGAQSLPQLVRLDPPHLVAAAFPLMKLLPARFILERALDSTSSHARELDADTMIVESSSGTFAMALAQSCREMGLTLTLVSGSDSMTLSLRQRLEGLNAVVDVVSPQPGVGIQAVRINRLRELARLHGRIFWPSQYHNPNNAYAYAPFAAQLVAEMGRVGCLVGSVGSGGSMCGTAHFLRRLFPGMRAIAVDTHGSVSFGQPDRERLLGGLGNSIRPGNLRHEMFDEVHWVTPAEAYLATLDLYRETGLRRGPTSGAAWLVGRWWALRNPGPTVVIMPDDGSRYEDDVYNEVWRNANAPLRSLPVAPEEMGLHLIEADATWTRFEWARRTLEDVTGSPPDPPIGEPTLAS